MVYINWDDEMHMRIELPAYCSIKQMVKVLRSARRINFSVKTIREETRTMFDSLIKFDVDQTTRARDYMIDTTNGVFADLMDTIIGTLDYGERTLDHSDRATSNSKYSSIDDAKLSYMKAISHMNEILAKNLSQLTPYGVYTRASIESYQRTR